VWRYRRWEGGSSRCIRMKGGIIQIFQSLGHQKSSCNGRQMFSWASRTCSRRQGHRCPSSTTENRSDQRKSIADPLFRAKKPYDFPKFCAGPRYTEVPCGVEYFSKIYSICFSPHAIDLSSIHRVPSLKLN
jgi:hypothetical protein